jgi:hypothetical protein
MRVLRPSANSRWRAAHQPWKADMATTPRASPSPSPATESWSPPLEREQEPQAQVAIMAGVMMA